MSEERKWYSVERDDFRLRCTHLQDVSTHHSRIPFVAFALYRLVVALYFFAYLIWFVVGSSDTLGVKFLIYLTDWTYIVVTFYLGIAVVNAFLDFRKRKKNDETEESIRYQVHWFLLNVSSTVSLIVAVVYWTTLRPFMTEKLPVYLDVSIHLLPSIVCLLDTLLTAVVVRFVHIVYPLAYLFVYLIFAVIYWAAGGTDPFGNPYIYPIIDFGNPGIAAVSVSAVLVATLLTQAALKGICALRIRCIDRRIEPIAHNHHIVVDMEPDNNQEDTQM